MNGISFNQQQWNVVAKLANKTFQNLPEVNEAYLKQLRLKSGLTQQDFAELLDVHLTTVSRWERIAGEVDVKANETIACRGDSQTASTEKPLTFSSLIKRQGLSVGGLAESMGFTPRTIGKWINGQALPHLSPQETSKLLDLLDCSLEELIQSLPKNNSYKPLDNPNYISDN